MDDPGGGIAEFCIALTNVEHYLSDEASRLNALIPATKALWKIKPEIFFRKGGLEQLLLSLFTDANLSVKEAHQRFAKIVYKLEQRTITIDKDSGYSSAIRRKLERVKTPPHLRT